MLECSTFHDLAELLQACIAELKRRLDLISDLASSLATFVVVGLGGADLLGITPCVSDERKGRVPLKATASHGTSG